MEIQITTNIRIAADHLQWIIKSRRIASGRERWDDVAFHKTLSGAVCGLMRFEVYDFEHVTPEDLETLCSHIDTFEANLVKFAEQKGLRRRPVRRTTIRFNKRVRIRSDHSQWIIEHLRKVRGRDKWEGVSFFQIFSKAVLSLVREQMRELDVTVPTNSVEAVCQDVDRLETEIVLALDRWKLPRDPDNAQPDNFKKARASFLRPRNLKPTNGLEKRASLGPHEGAVPTSIVVRA